MSKFAESPYFYLKDHHMISSEQILGNSSDDFGLLIGPRTTFVTEDIRDTGITFYVKDDDYGFRPIYLIPKYEEPEDKVYFKYYSASREEVLPGTQIENTIEGEEWIIDDPDLSNDEVINDGKVSVRFISEGPPSVYGPTDFYIQIPNSDTYPIIGNNYEFVIWDYSINQIDFDDVENNNEIYIRKDSEFHKWLMKYSNEFYEEVDGIEYNIRDYVNTDKTFIYFGKIFKDVD